MRGKKKNPGNQKELDKRRDNKSDGEETIKGRWLKQEKFREMWQMPSRGYK